MILYQYPGGGGLSSISPPCAKVEMALRLVGADYEVENIRSPARARQISVTGRLPVLEMDGERVPDSIAILDRLEQRFPDAALWPEDSQQRLTDRLWDHFVTDSTYWLGYYWRWIDPECSRRTFQALFGRLGLPARLGIRAFFVPRARRRAQLHGVGGKSTQMIHREMERAFRMIADGLNGGDFLQGRSHPGRGDLATTALLVQAGFRDTMPETMAQIRSHDALPGHCARVLEACGMPVPKWLE